jgi:hypothetical protein
VRQVGLAAIGVITLLFGASASVADEASDMAAAVNAFYGTFSTFHPSDGIPDAKARAKYEPFISPDLDKLLTQAAEAENTFAKANKDSPPLIEGDLFTSNFEGATSYKVGACKGDAKTGLCTVALIYDDRNDSPKDKPLTWNDTAYLVATPSGWRVDDIGYGESWEFGNKGKMSETVRSAIANASE